MISEGSGMEDVTWPESVAGKRRQLRGKPWMFQHLEGKSQEKL